MQETLNQLRQREKMTKLFDWAAFIFIVLLGIIGLVALTLLVIKNLL